MFSTEQLNENEAVDQRATNELYFFRSWQNFSEKKNLAQLRGTEYSQRILAQLRGMEYSWRMSPKYQNGRTVSKRTTYGNYTTDGQKGTHRQYSGLGTEMHPPTKKRTRENGAKMRLVRTGTLQPAECSYRQIISLGKPTAQCYGRNVSANPLCSEALI